VKLLLAAAFAVALLGGMLALVTVAPPTGTGAASGNSWRP
jgi:hypothetical protein